MSWAHDSRDRACVEIGERIVTGKLCRPERCSTSPSLAVEVGVDAPVVREALCFLQRDGFVRESDDGALRRDRARRARAARDLPGRAAARGPRGPQHARLPARRDRAPARDQRRHGARRPRRRRRGHARLPLPRGARPPLRQRAAARHAAPAQAPAAALRARLHGGRAQRRALGRPARGDRRRARARRPRGGRAWRVEANFRDAMPRLLERIESRADRLAAPQVSPGARAGHPNA